MTGNHKNGIFKITVLRAVMIYDDRFVDSVERINDTSKTDVVKRLSKYK